MKLSSRPFAFTSYKAFSKNKKRSGSSLPVSFSARFLIKNIFLLLNSINRSNFVVQLPLIYQILSNIIIAIFG